MHATLDSTPGVISQIFLCTNALSSFQRRSLSTSRKNLIDASPSVTGKTCVRQCYIPVTREINARQQYAESSDARLSMPVSGKWVPLL